MAEPLKESQTTDAFDNAKVMAMLASEHPEVVSRPEGAHRAEKGAPEAASQIEDIEQHAEAGPETMIDEARGILIDLADAKSAQLEGREYRGEDAAQQYVTLLRLGERTLEDALHLAKNTADLPPSQARELVALCTDLADQIHQVRPDNPSATAALEQLKTVVYGQSDIKPTEERERLGKAGQAPVNADPLMPEYSPVSQNYEWHGSPIRVESLSGFNRNPHLSSGLTDPSIITIRRGADGWYYQVGDGPPSLLKSDAPVTLGRAQLGGNTYISRSHLTIAAGPEEPAVQITDHSRIGTVVVRHEYPEPLPARA